MSIVEALSAIQAELKSPKDQRAKQYRYRNIEDINEAVKPLAAGHGCAVVYSDELRMLDGLPYVRATCTLTNGSEELSATGCALLNITPKEEAERMRQADAERRRTVGMFIGMSAEQGTGSASSYARKYAAQGLFAIDSSENDPDRREAGRTANDTKSPKSGVRAQRSASNDAKPSAKEALAKACEVKAEACGLSLQEVKRDVMARDDFEMTDEAMLRIANEITEAYK